MKTIITLITILSLCSCGTTKHQVESVSLSDFKARGKNYYQVITTSGDTIFTIDSYVKGDIIK